MRFSGFLMCSSAFCCIQVQFLAEKKCSMFYLCCTYWNTLQWCKLSIGIHVTYCPCILMQKIALDCMRCEQALREAEQALST